MEYFNLLTDKSNLEQNKEKSHYFIGNVLNDKNLIIKLKNLNQQLRTKYKLQESHINNLITTNLIYLGYFDIETAQVYMNNIFQYLLKSVTEKFAPLECNITNFNIDKDSSFFKIMLQYKDKNNYLEKIIIPYLYQNGIVPVLGNKRYNRRGSIDCIFFKDSSIIKNKKFRIMTEFPKETFEINNLCLIKGTPTKVRSGTPSIHDQLSYEVIKEYIYDFNGTKGSNNKISSLLGNKPSNDAENNEENELDISTLMKNNHVNNSNTKNSNINNSNSNTKNSNINNSNSNNSNSNNSNSNNSNSNTNNNQKNSNTKNSNTNNSRKNNNSKNNNSKKGLFSGLF